MNIYKVGYYSREESPRKYLIESKNQRLDLVLDAFRAESEKQV